MSKEVKGGDQSSDSRKKVYTIIILAVVILLVIAITLGVVLGTKPSPEPDTDDTTTEDTTDKDDEVVIVPPVWGEWQITKPTLINVGKAERTSDKGDKQTHELPTLDSDKYTKEVVVAPTTTAGGKDKYTIDIEGVKHSFEIDVDKLPIWNEWEITKPSLTSVGKAERTNDMDGKETHELPTLDSELYTIEHLVLPTYSDVGTDKYTIEIEGVEHSFEIEVATTDGSISLNVNDVALTDTISHNASDTITDAMIEKAMGTKDYSSYTVYSDATKQSKVTDIDTYVKDKEDVTLYIVKNYTISFNSNGGSAVESIELAYGAKYGDLSTPTLSKMVLDGWYDGAKYITADTVIDASNHTLKANWYMDGLAFVIKHMDDGYDFDQAHVSAEAGKEASIVDLVVPDVYHGYKVAKIAENGFSNCANLATAKLSANIEAIGSYAFGTNTTGSANKLTTITLPDELWFLGPGAFLNCKELESVNFVNKSTGLRMINNYVFSNCVKLKNFDIPENAESIGIEAFANCGLLSSANIGAKVNTIWNDAFLNCASIKTINIPDAVTDMYSRAFKGCTQLETVTMGKGLTELRDESFKGCSNLSSLTLGENIKTLDRESLMNCSKLGNVDLSNVTTIGPRAFNSCTSMTEINLPTTIKNISGGAFDGCSNLVIYVDVQESDKPVGWQNPIGYVKSIVWAGNVKYGLINGDTAYKVTGNTLGRNGAIAEITIPAQYRGKDVVELAVDAFRETNVTKVTLPDTITEIAAGAFYRCNMLESVTMSNNVTNIGKDAFLMASSLMSVNIGDKVETIGDGAFAECGELTSAIVLPKTLRSLGAKAFNNCEKLASITYAGTVAEWEQVQLGTDCLWNIWSSPKMKCSDGDSDRMAHGKH